VVVGALAVSTRYSRARRTSENTGSTSLAGATNVEKPAEEIVDVEVALQAFAAAAKERMLHTDGSFRRNYIQQLVQRAEVGTHQIRIMGSRSRLLQTLVASGGKPGVETAAHGVRSFDLKWLPGPDSNQRPTG
jgi:hypothetical protein